MVVCPTSCKEGFVPVYLTWLIFPSTLGKNVNVQLFLNEYEYCVPII